MRLFKKRVVKNIDGGAWGHLVNEHGIDVDTLSKHFRCVEREGTLNGQTVTYMRVFKPSEAEQKGITIAGWETFDEHPELVYFEGYVTLANKAHLERKKA